MRILFVDDEINILQGLKRSLWSLKSEWEMSFVEGGEAALELLKSQDFDIIVTDMRMPRMSGIELLEKVRTSHPQTIRFVLSGQTDQESAIRSANTAHQFLAKPCSSDDLMAAVKRATQLNKILTGDDLRTMVVQLRSIPSLPSLYNDLVAEVAKPEPSMNRISSIIETDIGMTAKVMQMVNSAFFGSPRRVESVFMATSMLGLDTIKALVIAASVFGSFDKNAVSWFDIEDIENRSMLCSQIAKLIATSEQLDKYQIGHAMFCGLLHDIGRIVLASSLKSIYRTIATNAAKQGCDLCELERAAFKTTHTEIGGYLLALWGFPNEIVEGTVYHHSPGRCETPELTIADIVHAACGFSNGCTPGDGASSCFDLIHFENKGFGQKVDEWYKESKNLIERAGGIGEISISNETARTAS